MHIGYSHSNDDQSTSNLATHFEGLNALEIAAVSGAKRFLSQRPVQRIVNAIWKGDIIFWSNLGSKATKRAQIYKGNSTDPYSRLRVPVYLKVFEILFFIAFLAFYYAVLVQRSFHAVTTVEVLLYIWIVSFAYNGMIVPVLLKSEAKDFQNWVNSGTLGRLFTCPTFGALGTLL